LDPIRSAAAFSDAQSVLDWVVRDLSLASPRTFFLGCIYRSYPALEMGLSAGCRDGHLVDVRGLHEAFCQSPTFFDRWVVESRQRNRWQDYTQIDIPVPLRQFWKLKTFNSFRRIVLCNGSRPMAYLSADLPPGSTWTHAELSGIDARYRQSSNALRLAALAWRARQARRWLPRDAELNEFVAHIGNSDSDRAGEAAADPRMGLSAERRIVSAPGGLLENQP